MLKVVSFILWRRGSSLGILLSYPSPLLARATHNSSSFPQLRVLYGIPPVQMPLCNVRLHRLPLYSSDCFCYDKISFASLCPYHEKLKWTWGPINQCENVVRARLSSQLFLPTVESSWITKKIISDVVSYFFKVFSNEILETCILTL